MTKYSIEINTQKNDNFPQYGLFSASVRVVDMVNYYIFK